MVLPALAHLIGWAMIAVIGCGNINRQDDGVGSEVVRILAGAWPPGKAVKIFDAGTDGMAVMFAARGCTTLIIVDAAKTGSRPGAVYEVPGAELEKPYRPGLNLHDFRWEAALHAGRQIFREAFPKDVVVLLIEAQDLGYGLGLSDAVAAAAVTVSQRISALIRERVAGSPA